MKHSKPRARRLRARVVGVITSIAFVGVALVCVIEQRVELPVEARAHP